MREESKNRLPYKLIALLFAGLMIFSYFSAISNSNAVGKRSHSELVLRVGIQGNLKTINPLAGDDLTSRTVLETIYDQLVRETSDGDIVPCVANSWEFTTPDFKNVTVILKEDVRWHDGVKLTADDIVFTYRFLSEFSSFESDLYCLRHSNGTIGVYKLDDYRIRFVLNVTYLPFVEKTLGAILLPKHIWSRFENDDGTFNATAAKEWDMTINGTYRCIGCGPFKFSNLCISTYYIDNDNIRRVVYRATVLRNDYYFKHVNITKIVFKSYYFLHEVTAALQKGLIDCFRWRCSWSIHLESWRSTHFLAAYTDRHVGSTLSRSTNFGYLGFNMRKSPFNHSTFRTAVSYAVDKEQFQYYWDPYYPDSVIASWNSLWYNDTLNRRSSNVEKAKSLFDSQGWNDTDGDGWREFPDIGDREIKLWCPSLCTDYAGNRIGEIIECQLQKIEVNVTCSYAEDPHFPLDSSPPVETDVDIWIGSWVINSNDPSYLYELFHSSQYPNGRNRCGYINSVFDDLIERANQEMNVSKRQYLVKLCQGVLYEDVPVEMLHYGVRFVELHRTDRFVGWLTFHGTLFNYWTLLNLHVTPTVQLRAIISAPLIMSSGEKETIKVVVRDDDRRYVEGAGISLTTSNGTIMPSNGMTDCYGCFYCTFSAPYIPPVDHGGNATIVIITLMSTSKLGYIDAPTRIIMIKVMPAVSHFLRVYMTAETDVVESSGFTPMTVTIRDQDRFRMEGVNLNLTIYPDIGTLCPSNGTTTIDGELDVVYKAPSLDNITSFVVVVKAECSTYDDSLDSIGVIVIPPSMPYEYQSIPPSFEIILFIAAICLASIAYGLIRKRRK